MRKLSGRLFIVFSLALLCCCLGFAVPALAGGPIDFVMPSGDTYPLYEYTDISVLLSNSYPHVSGDELVLPGDWYAVTENTTIDKRVRIDGAVFLVLCDDTTLTLNNGIHLTGNNDLEIFAQPGGSGRLVATASDMCSAIGGNADQPGGIMYVEGGNISATSSGMAAGIGGGGMGGSYGGRQWGGDLTVNRGTVTAVSTGGGAGIGCGAGAADDGGYLEINGGTVTARGTYWGGGDGVGGDGIDNACLELIRINGGTLIASSNPDTSNSKALVAERIEIVDSIQVRGGYDADSATLAVVTANSDGRRGACAQNYAMAKVCDHVGHDPYYPVSAETHTFECNACKAAIGEKPHEFSVGGVCSACGMPENVQITLLPGEANGQPLGFSVDHGTYEAPDCSFTAPARKVFKGWAYGDPAVVLQPGDPIDLPLTESVVLTALWKYPDLVVDGVTYTAWADNKTLPSTPGCWYLLNEVDRMTDCWTVPQGNTILNLNGNRIWRGAIGQGMSESGSVIRIPANATLTIRDTSGTNARIAGGNAPQGGCIYNAGKLYFESGRLGADNFVNANIANDGGAVYNTGTMVMSGGLIDHNKTLQYGGGAITNYGVFAITDGSISGNTAKLNGGGIWSSGTLTLGGGSITGNTAGDKGGGVYVKRTSSFRINGNVRVQGNTGSGGTNNVNLEGGAVIQVTDTVYSTSSIGLSVSEVTVGNNITVSTGFAGKSTADSFFSDSSSLAAGVNPSGELILGIPKNLTLEPGDGTSTTYTVKVPYGGVCALPECTFTPPESMTFRGWKLSSTSDTLDPGDEITVTDAVTATAQWRSLWAVLQQQINEAANGDVIVLAFDAQADRFHLPLSVPSGKTLTIDLNGHTISRSLSSATSGGNVITVGGTLTITDSAGGGIITGGWNSESGGGIVNSGNLTISGGTITGNVAELGAGIYMNSGTLSISGTAGINGNHKLALDGQLTNEPSNVFLSNGTMIYVTGPLSADTVIGVGAETNPFVIAGAPYVNDSVGSFVADDSGLSVRLNSSGDAILVEEHDVSIASGITGGSIIADLDRAYAGQTVTLTATAETDYTLRRLTVTSGGTTIETTEGANGVFHFTMPDADVTVTAMFRTDGQCLDFEDYTPWTATNSLPTQGTYVLENDIILSSPWGLVSEGSLNLCLNGHAIQFVSGGTWSANYAIELLGGVTLSVYDHTGNGRIIGDGLHPTVGVSNGTFNLYGGTLTGGGGAVYVNRLSSGFGYLSAFNMHGGCITGNSNGSSSFANCGGVYVGDGTFSISGNPTITGNTANGSECNVYLNNAVITVNGSLDYAARIGVTVPTLPADGNTVIVTSGLSGNGTEHIFTSDRHPSFVGVGLNANGEAALGWTATMTFNAGEGSGSMTSQKAIKGGVYTLPFHSFVNPDGKRFVGWQINGEGDPVEAYETIPVTGDTVLTAVWEAGSGPISQHVHEWVFTVDEGDPARATVICVAPELASDECNYKEAKWIRLNVSPLSKVYDGTSGFTATVERQILDLSTYVSGFPDEHVNVSGVTWYKADGTALTGIGPVNAGSYTAKVTVTAKNDAAKTATIRQEVTIEKAAAPSVTVTGLRDLPLTDESQPLVTATDVSAYGSIRYRLGDDGEWTDSIPQASASGTYDVYWYFESENYENIASEESPERVIASISEKHDHDGLRFTQWTAADRLPTAAGCYFLTGDVTLSEDWTVQNDISLCLNGNTVSGGGHQLTIRNGGALTLYAPEAENGGTLTGFAGDGGAILIEQGGSLTTRGVDMTALAGDSFANPQYSTTLVYTGAVTVFGTYTMDGGSITDSSGVRGGVYVSGGTFRVSGRVVITGNTVRSGGSNAGSNVYLESGSVITIAGTLEEDSSIGVRTWFDENENGGHLPEPGESITLTSGYGTHMGDVDPAAFFTYDYAYTNKRFVIGLEDGEAVVAQHAHNYRITGDDETDTVTVKCINPYCEYGDGAEYTVSLRAENAEFNYGPHPATVTSALPDGMHVTYSVSYAMADGTAYLGDDSTGEPWKIGDYTATMRVYVADDSPAHEASVSVNYSITTPVRPDSHVTVTPRANLAYTGGSQALVDFIDWAPDDVGGVYFSVDNPNPTSWSYHYRERPNGVPYNWTNPEPTATTVGTHTVYYYIPESGDTLFGFLAYGSAENPFSVEVTIRPRYTITFATEKGNISMAPVELIPEGESGVAMYTLPEPNVTALNFDIYGFAGWQMGDDTASLKPAGAEITVGGDMTLKAIWRPWHSISTPQVTGHGAVAVKSRAVEGETVALTITPDEGYKLYTLEVSSYGKVIAVTDGTFVMPNADVNSIIAAFKPAYCNVTFNAGDDAATGTMETVTVSSDSEYSLPGCGFTAPAEKAFSGWSVAIGGNDAVSMMPEDTIDVTADTTVTALWETITFDEPNFKIPEGVTSIEAYAFAGIAAKVVDIPANCTSIGDYAFSGCGNLTRIRIPKNCRLGTDVFDGCGMVYVFGTPNSPAEVYCRDHAKCVFIAEAQN